MKNDSTPNYNPNNCWIKHPGPGQFRGEGEWIRCSDLEGFTEEEWILIVKVNYVPWHVGDEPPKEE